jgi:hypothetical protein
MREWERKVDSTRAKKVNVHEVVDVDGDDDDDSDKWEDKEEGGDEDDNAPQLLQAAGNSQ